MSQLPARYDVSVVLQTGAASVRALIGHYGTAEELAEGSCRLRMSTDELGWPVMVLGVLGVPFTIESPPELRDRARRAAEALVVSLNR